MSKIATKAIESRWCQERYKAAAYNGRLSSREGAAEETGIERTRMARIELGTLTPYPEEALLMAETYRAPELKNFYCRECCPLGKNMPKVDNESLDRITVRAMSSMGKISKARDMLLEITEDGVVTDEERPELEKIIVLLDELTEINQNLKLWLEKNKVTSMDQSTHEVRIAWIFFINVLEKASGKHRQLENKSDGLKVLMWRLKKRKSASL